MYVCVYIYIYTHIYLSIHIYIYIYVYTVILILCHQPYKSAMPVSVKTTILFGQPLPWSPAAETAPLPLISCLKAECPTYLPLRRVFFSQTPLSLRQLPGAALSACAAPPVEKTRRRQQEQTPGPSQESSCLQKFFGQLISYRFVL